MNGYHRFGWVDINRFLQCVDPEGEEAEEPGDPPKRNVVQKIWDGYVKIDEACEGHSDGSNQVCEFTKRDWNVGLGISSALICPAAFFESGEWGPFMIGMANSIDDIASNNEGESISQQLTDNSPYANAIKITSSLFTGFKDIKSFIELDNAWFSALDAVGSGISLVNSTSAMIKPKNESVEKTSPNPACKPANNGTSQPSSFPLPSFCTQDAPQYELFLNSNRTRKNGQGQY